MQEGAFPIALHSAARFTELNSSPQAQVHPSRSGHTENTYNDLDQRRATNHCSDVCTVQFILAAKEKQAIVMLADVLRLRTQPHEWEHRYPFLLTVVLT